MIKKCEKKKAENKPEISQKSFIISAIKMHFIIRKVESSVYLKFTFQWEIYKTLIVAKTNMQKEQIPLNIF